MAKEPIRFVVYGEPVAQGRPRLSTMHGHARMHDPEKSVTYKQKVYAAVVPIKPETPLDGELIATIKAYFDIPKSKSGKWKRQALSGEIRPVKKPDTDNIAKIILDSCNGILFRDDSQIVRLVIDKFYSDSPRVEVELCGRCQDVSM